MINQAEVVSKQKEGPVQILHLEQAFMFIKETNQNYQLILK